MKKFFHLLLFNLLSLSVFAQNEQLSRHINFRQYGKDSIVLSFTKDYYLIEDSCAQIVRHGHFDFSNSRKFTGHFKDVSKDDTSKIVGEGNYDKNGEKNGEFITYYLNGNLQAKGNFKDDRYTGTWEFYYEDGKPRLTFEVDSGGDFNIIDARDKDDKILIKNGKGRYSVTSYLPGYHWEGKFNDGKPDGTWKLLTDNDSDNPPMITEYFNKGKFYKGVNSFTTYTDSSQIVFIKANELPLLNAERFVVSRATCDEIRYETEVVNAKYKFGDNALFDVVDRMLSSYFSRISNRFISTLELNGQINEKGQLVNLTDDEDKNTARGLILELSAQFPQFEPATVKGKPVVQNIVIILSVHNERYNFQYRLLPVDIK